MSERERRQGILTLPTELIHAILLALPPLCIEHFSQTCKLARQHVYGDSRAGDAHLWKQLYLKQFDDFPDLWEPSGESSNQDAEDGQQGPSASSASSSSRAASSIMSLVQLRARAARLYSGDPSNHGPITLNFNAVLSALLSVIDTAVPPHDSNPCRNTTWLDESVLALGQATWGEWIFPRSIMCSLEEYKTESAAANGSNTASNAPQERKRRRLTGDRSSPDKNSNKDDPSKAAAAPSSSRRRSSSSKSANGERPESSRRRSARLLKLMYPESLHGLVDEGIDIDALAQPLVRLAARMHCLHGIRAWKDSQKQRLTESPQEIHGQRQQDGLANEGAAQASAQAASATHTATSTQTETEGQQSHDGQELEEEANSTQNAVTTARDDDDGDDHDDDVADDENFDEPPDAILNFRPRMFGPSFGFCSAPDEEDQIRARMRHRVYDAGYYGWSNGYAPLHAWRYDPNADAQDDRDADQDEDEDQGGDDVDDIVMRDFGGYGSQDGDDDALREATELSDASDHIPDDPIPIEIEISTDGEGGRTFQVADRFGNPVNSSGPAEAPSATGWELSDDEDAAGEFDQGTGLVSAAPSRGPRPPSTLPTLGTYDAETRTYEYRGSGEVAIQTGERIVVRIGNTVDFVGRGVVNVRFIRPGELAEVMRVTSDNPDVDEDEDVDDEDLDDDYDEDADDWDDPELDDDDDDDNYIGPSLDVIRPLAGASGYRGCHANEEIKHLVEQYEAKRESGEKDENADEPSRRVSLRRKFIHWELVEAIMVVMYANLKEAIWLENWGVGIRIPKIFDDAGILVRDPMEKREFLEFPTGWISSLPSSQTSKSKGNDAEDEAYGDHQVVPTVTGSDFADTADEKPHDWARCEAFWAGTYAFLDYSHFMDFNMRMARRRSEALARSQAAADSKGKQMGSHQHSTPKPSLVGQPEAVGDCLQLRIEILPKSQQPAYNAEEEGQEDDPDYPTLYFRGTTVTYWGNDAPIPRGGVHGKVRPVYARSEDVDDLLSKGPRGKKKIEGLHWSIVHRYEHEDRWQLEGIQPGPPGTRAPIFGIWSDATHDSESPNGPFVYWMMDERPWKEIDRINRQEAHDAAGARAARFR